MPRSTLFSGIVSLMLIGTAWGQKAPSPALLSLESFPTDPTIAWFSAPNALLAVFFGQLTATETLAGAARQQHSSGYASAFSSGGFRLSVFSDTGGTLLVSMPRSRVTPEVRLSSGGGWQVQPGTAYLQANALALAPPN